MNIAQFDQYKLGQSEMDDEHLVLVKAASEAIHQIRMGNYQVAYYTLEYLFDQFNYHTAIEEALMKKYNYPQSSSHKLEHDRLKIMLLDIIKLVLTSKNDMSDELTNSIIDKLIIIVFDHISDYDHELAEFIALFQQAA